MRYVHLILLTAFWANTVCSQELAKFVPPENLARGQAIAKLPDAVNWNLELFVFEPRYWDAYQKAKAAELAKLGAGETVKFRVIIRQVGNFRVFQRLERDDIPTLSPPEDQIKEVITLSKRGCKITDACPIMPFSQEGFAELQKVLKTPELTYADHLFTTDAINAANGFSQKYDPLKLPKPKDLVARAVSGGTVILTAQQKEPTFRVYNIETKTLDKKEYPKGEFIKSLGNTIWLYTKAPDGQEYTTIYSNLETVQAIPGLAAQHTDTLGKWKESPEWSIWRVHGAAQRFLRENGEPKPYCVFPMERP